MFERCCPLTFKLTPSCNLLRVIDVQNTQGYTQHNCVFASFKAKK